MKVGKGKRRRGRRRGKGGDGRDGRVGTRIRSGRMRFSEPIGRNRFQDVFLAPHMCASRDFVDNGRKNCSPTVLLSRLSPFLSFRLPLLSFCIGVLADGLIIIRRRRENSIPRQVESVVSMTHPSSSVTERVTQITDTRKFYRCRILYLC